MTTDGRGGGVVLNVQCAANHEMLIYKGVTQLGMRFTMGWKRILKDEKIL